jgi:hypothetical protein
VFRALRSAAEGVETLREKVLRDSEDEIIKLVMLVAKKIIKGKLRRTEASFPSGSGCSGGCSGAGPDYCPPEP